MNSNHEDLSRRIYRADIDGLRAFAVISVVLFHFNIPGFSGGFCGVDVFFVISGFLITSIIQKQIDSGSFSLSDFYFRRIKRIFPALFCLVTVTTAFGLLLLRADELKSLGKSIIYLMGLSSNIMFCKRSGYFDVAAESMPLLHTWSLSIEEGFYVLFPIFLLAHKRFLRIPLLLSIGFCLITSFIYCQTLLKDRPNEAFYLLPSRSWELLAGAILSQGFPPTTISIVLRNLASIVGISFIGMSVFCFGNSTPFPGFSALLPVSGTVLVIYGGSTKESIINKVLAFRPLVFLGLNSYSIYLWHWPILFFTRVLVHRELAPLESIGLFISTLLVSFLSFHFVERPFRNFQTSEDTKTKRIVFSSAFGTILLLLIVGRAVLGFANSQIRASATEASSSAAQDLYWQKSGDYEKPLEQLGQGSLPAVIGESNVIPSFIVWGDSHARALLPALESQAKRFALAGFVACKSGNAPILGVREIPQRNSEVLLSPKTNEEIFSFIKNHPEIKTVFLAGIWEWYSNGYHFGSDDSRKVRLGATTAGFSDLADSNHSLLRAGLLRSINFLVNENRTVVVISDIPELKFHIKKYVNFAPNTIALNEAQPTFAEYAARNKNVYGLLEEISRFQNVSVVYPEVFLVNEAGRFIVTKGDRVLYLDSHHLSSEGALLVAPAFDFVFTNMVNH
jgi:peptidoglycan/LPS O-acetylase OafA/YrhL